MSTMWRRGDNGNNDDNIGNSVCHKNYRDKNWPKALVVGDDGVGRVFSSAMLQMCGVQVRIAYSGREAVDCVTGGEVFDIIFVDMYMTAMNGLETIRMLRAMGFRNKIVGVGSENRENIEAEERDILMAGADYYVPKPLSFPQIRFFVAEIEGAT